MKITIKNKIKVELSSLIRLEWKNFLPVLTIHERFEKLVKWTLRILTFIGIATSIISIDEWYISLSLSILLFLIEQFFERTVFEYTTFVSLPFPDFDIDYSQWKTNGFLVSHNKAIEPLSYMGPSFQNRDYAMRFFNYLMSWNWDSSIDDENTIVVSFVIEPDEKYTTYIYSNPGRKIIDRIFEAEAKKNQLSKYGKRQQKLFTQMIFCNTLDFKEGYLIKQFLEAVKPQDQFYFLPTVLPQNPGEAPEYLYDYAILKSEYRLRSRAEIGKNDVEHYLRPN